MPPGQPVNRCEECRLYRPLRPFDGLWLCVDCSAHSQVATDGGREQ